MQTRDSTSIAPRSAHETPLKKGLLSGEAVIGWLSRGLLLALLVGLPWWFGGVQPLPQAIAAAVVLTALLIGLLGHSVSSPRIHLALPAVLLAALALGAVQLIPLPDPILKIVAPASARTWEQLTDHNLSAAAEIDRGVETGYWSSRQWNPISLYPASGKRDLALLCVGVGTFFLGMVQFTTEKAILAALIAITLCGAAFAFFGIVQQLTWNGKIYGHVTLTKGGGPFAAYVNRNSAGGYLNLSLATSLGLLFYSFLRSPTTLLRTPSSRNLASSCHLPPATRHPLPLRSPVSGLRTPSSRDPLRLLANLTPFQIFTITTSTLLLGAIGCTLSRGAMLATVLSLGLLALVSGLLARHRILNLAGWTFLALAGIGLTAWVGRFDDVQRRSEWITTVVSHPDGRWFHWRDCLSVAADFWPTGSGLGTHRFIYRLYETFPTSAWFKHAESQYMEALVDGGLPGLTLLLLAVGLTFHAAWRLLHYGNNRLDIVLGVVGLFAISTQAIQSCFDFGLYLPANMGTLALLTGIVWARQVAGRRSQVAGEDRNPEYGVLSTGYRVLFFPLCLALAAATLTLSATARADLALRPLFPEPTEPAEIGVDDARIRAVELAARLTPDNAETRLRAAQAWIERYRQQAWQQLIAERPGVDPAQLWALTHPAEAHTQLKILEQSRRTIEAENVRSARHVRDNLGPAVKHLLASREGCPLLPECHLLIAEVATMITPSAESNLDVQRVLTCAPRDSALLAEAGLIAMVDSQPELAAAVWRQASSVDPQRFPQLLRMAASQPVMQPHLEKLLPEDVPLLVDAVREHFSASESATDQDRALRQLITKYAKEILPAAKIDESQRWHLEGVLHLLADEPEAALEPLTKATQQEPLKVNWRFDLATALAANGLTDQARDHASFCARMEPHNEEYQTFLKALIRTSLTTTP